MEKRPIGSLNVSVVGIGTNQFGLTLDEKDSRNVLDAVLASEVNFIDTADTYGTTMSEEFIGRALRNRRDDVVLATKFGSRIDDDHLGGGKASYLISALENSLRRLRTDRIDLYIFHRPDPKTPIGETLAALDDMVRSGKIREIGCSAFSVQQLRDAQAAARSIGVRFVNLQSQYSVLHRRPENGVLAECVRQGIAFVPYAPLARGLLTGKYRQGEAPAAGTRLGNAPEDRRARLLDDQNFSIVESLNEFCIQRGHTVLELAFSWLLAHPVVASVIAGASSSKQVLANVSAAGWTLNADDLAEIDKIAPIDGPVQELER